MPPQYLPLEVCQARQGTQNLLDGYVKGEQTSVVTHLSFSKMAKSTVSLVSFPDGLEGSDTLSVSSSISWVSFIASQKYVLRNVEIWDPESLCQTLFRYIFICKLAGPQPPDQITYLQLASCCARLETIVLWHKPKPELNLLCHFVGQHFFQLLHLLLHRLWVASFEWVRNRIWFEHYLSQSVNVRPTFGEVNRWKETCNWIK